MIDMTETIAPKSDQLNADDLIGAPRTITVTRVTGGDGDQPVSIHYERDGGKPFKPCKTMRRVLMAAWGPYASRDYPGRSMTLYRDDRVTFGGLEVGGIRISHLSHIDKEMLVVVLKTKGKKAGIKIHPLQMEQKVDRVADGVRDLLARIEAGEDVASEPAVQTQRAWLTKNRPELAAKVDAAIAAVAGDDSPFAEGPSDTDRGEAHATTDAEADILAHLARKMRTEDVNSLVNDRMGELDEDGQQRLRDRATARIAEIRGGA